MKQLLNKRGQMMLAYVLVLTAVVAGAVAAAPLIKEKVQDYLEHAVTEMYNTVTTNLKSQK